MENKGKAKTDSKSPILLMEVTFALFEQTESENKTDDRIGQSVSDCVAFVAGVGQKIKDHCQGKADVCNRKADRNDKGKKRVFIIGIFGRCEIQGEYTC